MTDKEIIIDGIDVSGCIHYKNKSCIADYCLTDMPFSEAKCELNPNCYYKQLKRKEQECEDLKKKKEENTTFYLKKYANKDSECLELEHKLKQAEEKLKQK